MGYIRRHNDLNVLDDGVDGLDGGKVHGIL
jgi:hypothetical protein